MKYRRGNILYTVYDFAVVQVTYDCEVDYGGHGSGYQEDFCYWPDGSRREALILFRSRAEATKYLRNQKKYKLQSIRDEIEALEQKAASIGARP